MRGGSRIPTVGVDVRNRNWGLLLLLLLLYELLSVGLNELWLLDKLLLLLLTVSLLPHVYVDLLWRSCWLAVGGSRYEVLPTTIISMNSEELYIE